MLLAVKSLHDGRDHRVVCMLLMPRHARVCGRAGAGGPGGLAGAAAEQGAGAGTGREGDGVCMSLLTYRHQLPSYLPAPVSMSLLIYRYQSA